MSGEFAIDVSRFGAKTGRQIGLAVRKIALDLFTRVIMRSPVDTGRFRANWQTTVGERATGTREAFDKGPVLPGGIGAAVGSTAASEALQVVTRAPLGPDLWLANNLPYAVPLENGHSPQAPGGMVKLSMLEVPGIVASAAKASADEVRS
ncbi:MAG: HK97 gp10 family phage protein [Planctomycetes bacterium]|nr:HK97 gp10 family phage protein [Planctomycetota bacterium]